MRTKRKYHKTHLTRPRKQGAAKTRRRLEQRRRLVGLGMNESEVAGARNQIRVPVFLVWRGFISYLWSCGFLSRSAALWRGLQTRWVIMAYKVVLLALPAEPSKHREIFQRRGVSFHLEDSADLS